MYRIANYEYGQTNDLFLLSDKLCGFYTSYKDYFQHCYDKKYNGCSCDQSLCMSRVSTCPLSKSTCLVFCTCNSCCVVVSMCCLNVLSQCVVSMCCLNVLSQCVVLMCCLNVLSQCAVSMCCLNVLF